MHDFHTGGGAVSDASPPLHVVAGELPADVAMITSDYGNVSFALKTRRGWYGRIGASER